YGAKTSTLATVAGAALALVLGVIALAVSFFRKKYDALITLTTLASVCLTLGWGLIARGTGGVSSPYLMALPFACVGIVGLVPIPPRFSIVCAVAAYVGLWVA